MAAKRVGALGPLDEAVDLMLSGAGGQHTVRFEFQAPIVARRQLPHCRLALDHFRERRGAKHPRCKRRASARRGPGSEPLKERGPPEEIKIKCVRVIGQIDAVRRVAARERMPVPHSTRHRPQVDDPQRVVPGDALVDARVPGDEDAEEDEEKDCRHHQHWRRTARQRPQQTGRRDEERRQAQVRNPSGELRVPLGVLGVAGGIAGVRNGCWNLSCHAACSMPAGLRAAMFSRQ